MKSGINRALVIGVSDYNETTMNDLEFCRNDGERMLEILRTIGYDTSNNTDSNLIGHVKFDQLRNSIFDFFANPNNGANDTLIFYYSGHGIPDSDGDVYLSTSEIDPEEPYRFGFSFNDLTRRINSCVSTKIVVILDCCYSGAAKISKGIGKGTEDSLANVATAAISNKSKTFEENKGVCLLAASQAAQEAYALREGENSLFTHYLIEGLKGKMEAVDINGNVTAESLGKYLHSSIVNLPADKRPRQIPIRKMEVTDEIVIAQYPSLSNKNLSDPKMQLRNSKFFYISSYQNNPHQFAHSDRVFDTIIVPVSNECHIEIIHSNKKLKIEDLISSLTTSVSYDEFAIIDLTFNDPELYYLIGLYHALRKPVIIIKNSSIDPHLVEIPGNQTIEFNLENGDEIEQCKNELVRQIKLIDMKILPFALTLPPKAELIFGESEVLNFLNKYKQETKNEYWAMWISDEYDKKALLDYYSKESRMDIGCITRLINTKIVDKSLIKEHIKMFREDIDSGKYAIFSTNQSSYEIIYCHKDKRNAVAGLLFLDNIYNKIDLAIYSEDSAFVEYVKTRFRDFQGQGKRLRIDDDLEKNVDEWIKQTT
jgi:hypothetical protein